MCGLAGFILTEGIPDGAAPGEFLELMGASLFHRGPDAGSVYLDDGVGMVHRRLSILDLSEAGTQPMESASGRFVIVFNGEIYNYQTLRNELQQAGYQFRTGTDTEVFVNLYEQIGADCLHQLNGMFAAVIWDKETQKLFIARDRLGKKPLYYYHHNGYFAFASEIKALQELPWLTFTVRSDALKDFFFYQYIPDPKSIYTEVNKLPPGHWLVTEGSEVFPQKYWDLDFSAVQNGKESDYIAGLRQELGEAVARRMISDVPLGAFLSGGIDSSAVVALMTKHSSVPVSTCAIGFDSEEFDEVDYAHRVAQQYKTNHKEFTVRETVSENLQSISRFFDEPFADPSFVPTFFVAKLARQSVTVALAGDGGDENFAGYGKYAIDALENRLRELIPNSFRRQILPSLATLCKKIPSRFGRKASSLLLSISLDPATAFYISNRFCDPAIWDRLIVDDLANQTEDYDPADITRNYYREAKADDHLGRILYTDFKTYLPGDILVKVDRMTMANSLEARAPLLDYRVVEYASKLPSKFKLRGNKKKYLLKKAFENELPYDILYRKKMGFSVPLAQWLRNEIKSLAFNLLIGPGSRLDRFFKVSVIEELWSVHQAGNDRYTQELWTLLTFALWWNVYGDRVNLKPEDL